MSYKQIISKILINLSEEVKKEENRKIIKQDILEPIIYEIIYSFYPYLLSFIIIIFITFFLIIAILFESLRIIYKGGKYYARYKKPNDTITLEGMF